MQAWSSVLQYSKVSITLYDDGNTIFRNVGTVLPIGMASHLRSLYINQYRCGRDRAVGIATWYGLAVRESNPVGVNIFRIRPDRPWGPPSLLYNGYRIFPGGKAAGAWR